MSLPFVSQPATQIRVTTITYLSEVILGAYQAGNILFAHSDICGSLTMSCYCLGAAVAVVGGSRERRRIYYCCRGSPALGVVMAMPDALLLLLVAPC